MLRKKKGEDQSVRVALICVSLKENPICHENAVACRANGSAVDMPARDDIYLLLSRLRSLKIPENSPGSFHSDAGGTYSIYPLGKHHAAPHASGRGHEQNGA